MSFWNRLILLGSLSFFVFSAFFSVLFMDINLRASRLSQPETKIVFPFVSEMLSQEPYTKIQSWPLLCYSTKGFTNYINHKTQHEGFALLLRGKTQEGGLMEIYGNSAQIEIYTHEYNIVQNPDLLQGEQDLTSGTICQITRAKDIKWFDRQ